MKIAIVTAVYAPMINGVAVFAANLARGLAKRGHEVLVVTPEKGVGSDEACDGASDSVAMRYTKSVELKLYPDQIRKAEKGRGGLYRHGLRVSAAPGREVARILDEFGPEVVHVQTMDPVGKAAAKWAKRHNRELARSEVAKGRSGTASAGRKVALVSTEHNQPEVLIESLGLPGVLERWVGKWLGWYLIRQQQKSDFVTMPTGEAVRNLVVRPGRVLGPPVAAISNGVDLARFAPGKVGAEFYRRYDLPRNVPVVLYVGRVDPEKQVGRVLAALAQMVKEAQDDAGHGNGRKRAGIEQGRLESEETKKAHLVVVGDGVALGKLRDLAKRLGVAERVHFAGRVVGEDLAKMYQIGTVFATASEVETQGIVLIEAAASGLPLVAVDGGAVKEVCRDGENGFLCRPGDTQQMAEALAKVISDDKLWRKMSAESLKIAKKHSLEATLEQFENVYRKALALVNDASGK